NPSTKKTKKNNGLVPNHLSRRYPNQAPSTIASTNASPTLLIAPSDRAVSCIGVRGFSGSMAEVYLRPRRGTAPSDAAELDAKSKRRRGYTPSTSVPAPATMRPGVTAGENSALDAASPGVIHIDTTMRT